MRALAVVALALLAGCTLVPAPEPRDVAGPTDGYAPTSQFLKVFVKPKGGNATLVDFDRRDWYVAKIAERLDERELTFLSVRGRERIPGEVTPDEVIAPEDVAALRYDAMRSTAQQRGAMDAQYEELLQRAARLPPSFPTVPLP